MATAYSKLYLLENYIRDFLENKLYEKYKDDWWSKGVPNNIKPKAEKNKNKDKRDKNYIYYLDFGDLRKIIQYKENWSSIFSEIFKTQTGIIGRLEELEPIRHSIAHTRMLNNGELLKIELFFKEIPEMIGIPQKQNHACVS